MIEASMSDFVALGIVAVVVGFFVYAMAPRHWQTPLGFTIIVCAMPAGFAAVALLSQPALLIPAALFLGILIAGRGA